MLRTPDELAGRSAAPGRRCRARGSALDSRAAGRRHPAGAGDRRTVVVAEPIDDLTRSQRRCGSPLLVVGFPVLLARARR